MKCDWVNVSILLFLIFRFDSSIRPPARIRERPLNPPILGDFELRFPQNWGLGASSTSGLRQNFIHAGGLFSVNAAKLRSLLRSRLPTARSRQKIPSGRDLRIAFSVYLEWERTETVEGAEKTTFLCSFQII